MTPDRRVRSGVFHVEPIINKEKTRGRLAMTIELTRADPFIFALGLAFSFWMRRRPVFFAKFFALRWLGGLLIGGEFHADQARRDPPGWLISIVSWFGLIGI